VQVNPTVVTVGLAYLAGVAAIGAWAARRTRTARDFFAAGKGIGIAALSLSTMSATLSGFVFIGGPGLMQSAGLGALFIVLSTGVTGALGAWVVGRRLRLLAEVREILTVPDALAARFGGGWVPGLAAAGILVAVVGYMATNLLALGVVVDTLFGTGVGWGIWLGTAVLVAYTATGGILAAIYTDVLQGGLMAAASIWIFSVALEAGGGLAAISRTLVEADPGFLAPFGHLSPMTAVGFYLLFAVGSLGQPHVIHKFIMLRDPRTLRWYPLAMTGGMTVVLLLLFAVGITTRALVLRGEMPPLAAPDQATPAFLLAYAPPLLAGVVFAGVLAAIMSTLNSFMNVGAAALTRDLPRALGRPVADELTVGRWTTVALSLVAAGAAQASGTLVAFLGIFGFGLFASTLVPGVAVGLNWAGATRRAATASLVAGIGSTVVLEVLAFFDVFTLPGSLGIPVTALCLSLAVLIGGSLLDPAGRSATHLDPAVREALRA
jgi:Na+/proline symporter